MEKTKKMNLSPTQKKKLYNTRLGENLLIIRKSLKMTIKQIAKVLGIGESTYHMCERGKHSLRCNLVMIISKKYKIPIKEFYKNV